MPKSIDNPCRKCRAAEGSRSFNGLCVGCGRWVTFPVRAHVKARLDEMRGNGYRRLSCNDVIETLLARPAVKPKAARS